MENNEVIIGQKVIYEGYKVGFIRDVQYDVAGFDIAVLVQGSYYKNFMWFEAQALEKG